MNQTLLNFVLALVTNELLHNMIEIKSARDKVKRLDTYINNKSYKEMRINIDTRVKSYAASVAGFLVFVLPLWAVYSFLDLQLDTALKLMALLLLVSFIASAYSFDKYHVDIERVTRPFMKKK